MVIHRTGINSLFALLLLSVPHWASAQGEVLTPLTLRPDPRSAMPKSGHNTHFIYQYDTQDIPLVDDFSIDRTRQRWAHPDDEGVSLTEVIQHLVADGISTPDMAFSLDTTFTYFTDIGPDSVFSYREPLPEVLVLVNELGSYPVEGEEVVAWPAYNVFDTLQVPGSDTLWLPGPDLLQDSLMVYTVAPASGVYVTPTGVQQPLILWEDDDVYVNDTYPVLPPTIGVATFDGLSRTGIPYDFMNFSAHGIADRLTSVPINLQRPASDSIYLSFFYQARGLSGDIYGQAIDSLILEFYAPQENLWYSVWGTPYNAMDPFQQPQFQQVMIPIKEYRYLQNGFRMRFSNYATLSGSFDHWHLDYVRLAAQRAFDDTVIVDVAYVYPEASLLETYTSVPYNKFIQSPAVLMANTVAIPQRNLDVNDRFITYGFQAGLENGAPQSFSSGTNTANNANSVFNSTHPVGGAGYVHETTAEDAAFYEVKFWTNTTPDINRYNDTTSFIQEISNYYAYDDGSTEMGYGLNSAGGRLAYRFDLLGADSLRAVRMYFNPQANLPPAGHPTTGSFLLTVWNNLTIGDEGIIHQNFSFSSPEYRPHGLNKFVEYPLDSAIHVEGTIYIGWVQTNNVNMNLGFDRNRNNQGKIFYKTGANWENTNFEGSLMMRPVFVSEVDPFVGLEDLFEARASGMAIYPNPASESFNIRFSDDPVGVITVQCLDALGRSVLRTNYRAGETISTAGLADGVYIVRVTDAQGIPISDSRLIVQR